MLLLKCEALKDLKLQLAWSEEVEEAPRGRPPEAARQIRLERSRSRDGAQRELWPKEIMSFRRRRQRRVESTKSRTE